jgi:hypothetical protein
MQKFFTIFILIICPLFSYAQFEINTIDSISRSRNADQGAFGVSAVVHNDQIHLAYFYGATNGRFSMIYEVRDKGRRVIRENVYNFQRSLGSEGSKTSIQFNEDGEPVIYASYLFSGTPIYSVFPKESGRWSVIGVPYFTSGVWTSAHVDGSVDPGFAGIATAMVTGPIEFFYDSGIQWANEVVYDSPNFKTYPRMFNHDGVTYISFAENEDNDLITLYVYRKEGSNWVEDFSFQYTGTGIQATVPIQDLWTIFGENNGQLYLLHNLLAGSGTSETLTLLTKSNGSWAEQTLSGQENYNGSDVAQDILDFDRNGAFYLASNAGDNILHWVNGGLELASSDGSMMTIPAGQIEDIVVKDDHVYIYYLTGDKGAPFNDPLTFKEATLSLWILTDTEEAASDIISSVEVSPNPATEEVRLSFDIEEATDCSIQWMSLEGRNIGSQMDFQLPAGSSSREINTQDKPRGLYMLKISAGEATKYLPVILK